MRCLLLPCALVALSATLAAQPAVDLATVSRIKERGLATSQALTTASWLADVYGPRVTGTPQLQDASAWAMARFKEWGLSNIHQERFAFGQGWRVDRFTALMLEPAAQPIVGFPRQYSPSTPGTVTAEVTRVDIRTDADFQKYAGKLKGHIVLPQGPRRVRMLDDRVVLRMNDSDIDEVNATPVPAPAAPQAAARRPGQPTFAERVAQFYVNEGVVALLERGSDSDLSAGGSELTWMTQRVDGGTVFPGVGGSRDPKQVAQVPSATIAVEHYNRMLRILEKGLPVKVELNIQTTFYPEQASSPNGINTIAEIPGTDLASEVVMIGAHLDSHAFGTGATDNATGVSAMMETVRLFQALGLKPRRTVRIALWSGEEQGLLGSRAYVKEHFGTPADGSTKPAHAKLAAYFNLDNGTGKIRGIWAQQNLGAMERFGPWVAALKDLGVEFIGPRSVASTDHLPFDEAGLPGFQFIQERLEYNSRTHHSTMDFLDRIQRDDLVQQGVVAAVFTWFAANEPAMVPRKAVEPAKSR